MVKKEKKQSLFGGRHKHVDASHQDIRHRLIEVEKFGDVTWINVQDGQPSEISKIAEHYNIHSLHVHPVLNSGQASQLAAEDNYLFVLLRQPYVSADHHKILTSPIAMYLGKNFLITFHSSKTPIPKQWFDELKQQQASEINSAAHILYHLITHLLEEIHAQTDKITAQLDRVEGLVFDNANSDSIEIGRLRQKILRLRRSLVGQKNVLEELHDSIDKFSNENLRRYYLSNTNLCRRLSEMIEEAKEAVEIYKDADFTASTERTNEILAVLTIIFTLAIPATLVSTFYGMNVTIPGSLNGQTWNFLGPYTTLILVVGFSILSAIAMYVWFKKKKWF